MRTVWAKWGKWRISGHKHSHILHIYKTWKRQLKTFFQESLKFLFKFLRFCSRQIVTKFRLVFTFRSHFYAPPPESGGALCYTLRNFECPSVRLSVCPSVRPSVRPSAPTTILVSATPPTVLGQSFWNFTGVLRMVWRYAYCFFRILKLFFITFFPFLT